MFSHYFTGANLKKIAVSFYNFFSSVRLAVFLLFGLFFLTLIGTLYQVDYGLYAAQQRFFYSWFFLAGGFFPFPAAKLLLLLFSINLMFAAYRRYRFRVAKMGIIMIHYGIIFLLLGSFIGHYNSQESFISLFEGEETTFSEDYYRSEISIWKEENEGELVLQKVQSFDLDYLDKDTDGRVGESIFFSDFGIELRPIYFYKNAFPSNIFQENIENMSGIKILDYKSLPKQRENTIPGGLFVLNADFISGEKRILLWEGEEAPFVIKNGKETYYISIHRKRYALPFKIKLRRFKRELYYASDIPKEFESEVSIVKDGEQELPARIYMNNPFRLDGFTFYQASFSIMEDGARRSILATVKHPGYFVPYVASIIITLGLFYHFIYMMLARRRKD